MSMTKIYESPMQEIYFDENSFVIKNIWLDTKISFDDMKKEMHNWMQKFNTTGAKYMLTDSSLGVIVSPEIQDWIVSFLFPTVVEKGVTKYAILSSEEIFSQVSVEQMFSEDKNLTSEKFQQYFFQKNEEVKAMSWFNS